jgi:hypothetical protein
MDRLAMTKTLLVTAAVLIGLTVGASAQAQGWANPWSEEDGPDRMYMALTKVACGLGKDVQRFVVWLPFDTKTNQTLDFYRLTPQLPAVPLKGAKFELKPGNNGIPEVFLDGKKCERWPGGEQ